MSNVSNDSAQTFTVGEYLVLASSNLVVINEMEIKITPKMLLVLIKLAENQGKTVSKVQLLTAAWPDTVTSDMVLSKAISDLRHVFNESAKEQKYIRTVSKKGYRLLQRVRWNPPTHQGESEQRKNQVSIKSRAVIGIFVLISVGLALFIVFKDGENFNFAKTASVLNLTADKKIQRNPRYSNDGNYVIYSAFNPALDNPRVEIVLHSLLRNERTVIRKSNVDATQWHEVSFAFSPDSKTVLIKEQDGFNCEIIKFELLDRSQEKILDCISTRSSNIDWSPDGRTLVYSELNEEKKISSIILVELTNPTKKLVIHSLKTSFGFRNPRFSKDGTRLAVIKVTGLTASFEVGIVNLESNLYQTVLSTERRINDLTWTGENRVAYLSERGLNPGIWEIDLKLGKKNHIHHSSNTIIDLDYSFIKNEFLFTESRISYEIWQSKKGGDGQVIKTQVQLNGWKNMIPRLSPDESYLAYLSLASGLESIIVRHLESGIEKTIFSEQNVKVAGFRWSKDGRNLLTTIVDKNVGHLIIIDSKSGRQEKVDTAGSVSNGRWSNDGKKIYWLKDKSNPNQLYEFNLRENRMSLLLTEIEHEFEVVDDGDIYVRFNSEPGRPSSIRQLSRVDEAHSQVIIEDINLGNWVVRGKNLYYTIKHNSENNEMLVKYETQTSVSSNLFMLDPRIYLALNQIDVNDAGTVAFYTISAPLGSDLYRLMK